MTKICCFLCGLALCGAHSQTPQVHPGSINCCGKSIQEHVTRHVSPWQAERRPHLCPKITIIAGQHGLPAACLMERNDANGRVAPRIGSLAAYIVIHIIYYIYTCHVLSGIISML